MENIMIGVLIIIAFFLPLFLLLALDMKLWRQLADAVYKFPGVNSDNFTPGTEEYRNAIEQELSFYNWVLAPEQRKMMQDAIWPYGTLFLYLRAKFRRQKNWLPRWPGTTTTP